MAVPVSDPAQQLNHPVLRNQISRVPYLPGLDGLRALAVIAVIVYHADSRWLGGGFLGVEVFFVISGYLITLLLVAERERVAAALRTESALTVYPSGANFVLFRVHGDGHGVWQRLVDHGVLVRDFSRWPRVENCLRVTIGTPDENNRFLEALHEALDRPEAGA